jgi:hypothetical protein
MTITMDISIDSVSSDGTILRYCKGCKSRKERSSNFKASMGKPGGYNRRCMGCAKRDQPSQPKKPRTNTVSVPDHTSTSEPSSELPTTAPSATAAVPVDLDSVFSDNEFVGLGVLQYEDLFQKLPMDNKAYSFTAIVDLAGLTESGDLRAKADDFVGLFWEKTQMRFE